MNTVCYEWTIFQYKSSRGKGEVVLICTWSTFILSCLIDSVSKHCLKLLSQKLSLRINLEVWAISVYIRPIVAYITKQKHTNLSNKDNIIWHQNQLERYWFLIKKILYTINCSSYFIVLILSFYKAFLFAFVVVRPSHIFCIRV